MKHSVKSRAAAFFHNPNYTLVGLIFIVLIFGLIMLSSASAPDGFGSHGDPYYFVKRQLLYGVLLGLPALWAFSRLDYHIWKKLAFPLIFLNIVLLLAVLIPGVGVELLGARRWIDLGGILFQPSEVIKLTFLLYLGVWLEAREKSQAIHDFSTGFMPFMVMVSFMVLIIAGLQKDLGTMVVIAVIAIVSYYVAGAPWKHLGIIFAAAGATFFVMVKVLPLFMSSFVYRAERLSVFLHPDLDPLGIGFHINQALLAIGSGGMFGLGLGHSRQKFNYLPEVATDSIFAVVAEEMGFIITVSVVALFMAIMWQGVQVAKHAPDSFGKIVATGVVTWISFQAVVNMMAMLSLLPLTGIPLPLISYGSTSMATILAAVGILINISRQTSLQR
jgi:cell division protein FtsW